MNLERPNVLRGVHFGPGTSLGFDIPWWVEFLESMHIGWVKIVDDAGSMMEFAAACRAAGIMPIIRLYRQYPYPGRLREKDWVALKEYLRRDITRWFEIGNEPNLWEEWPPEKRPAEWHEGEPAVWERPEVLSYHIPTIINDWMLDAEAIIALGGYPAFPAMAQCGFHPVSGSLPIYRALFNYMNDHYHDRAEAVWENGGWLSVHDATLNHFYHDGQEWHFEYPYDPSCQSRHPGMTIMDNDNSLIGHEAPRDMLTNRWGLRVPIISTEGGVFLDVGTQWDANYPGISSAEYHGQGTLAMFNWLDEYQKTHQWFYGMCPWIIAGQVLGHPTHWEKESWKKVDREEPVIQMLRDNPPRQLDAEIPEPVPVPIPVPDPQPTPDPAPGGFPRPPGDNGLGIHAGLELLDETIAQDVLWMKAMRIHWATVAYTNEEAMLKAARALWAEGIMPICRWVGTIGKTYDFARDARLLIENGIPAYIQIFNEPSDDREWKDGIPADYIEKWANLWALKAGEVMAVGGLPGLQCLHPEELAAVFAILPPDNHVWDKAWFCSHNYGLNHPPDWKEDYWGVLGWEVFAEMFSQYLGGYVPPIICGEGGWLYKASNDDRYPIVDDKLHAQYHNEMYRWFLGGNLSDGSPLPDYLFAVCPWILSGPSDEAWFGWTERVQTIQAVQAIPEFVRGDTPPPVPTPESLYPRVYDETGVEQDWAWAVEKYGVEVERTEHQPYAYRCVELRERIGPSSVDVWVYNENGKPVAGAAIFFAWPDGSAFQPTDYNGRAGFAYGSGSKYNRELGGGPHYIEVQNALSDRVRGLGILMGTNHAHLDLAFQYLPNPEPIPEPYPDPEIDLEVYTLVGRLVRAPHGFKDYRDQVREVRGVNMPAVITESYMAGRITENGSPLFHKLDMIVVHHLGDDYLGALELVEWAVNDCKNVHHDTCPYHFLIEKSGRILFMVSIKYLVHHAYGVNNTAIGIVFEDEGNDKQLESGRFLIAALEELMGGDWGVSRHLGLMPHSSVWNGEKWYSACPGPKIWPRLLRSGPWPRLTIP